MDTRTAAAMIRRRLGDSSQAPQLNKDSVFLLTAFGGGIPREIVRNLRTVTLDASPGQRIPSRKVAITLFQAAVQEWIDHLPEIPMSGEEAIALRANALDVLAKLSELSNDKVWPPAILARLNECLAILDPADLRLAAGGEQAEDAGSLSQSAVLREVQYCLRLMIMDALLEKFWRKDESWRESVESALECLRVLPDQPALAESMMQEMRKGDGALPLPEKTWRHRRAQSAHPPGNPCAAAEPKVKTG